MVIFAANTVDSPEALNDADGIPVNVVVNEIVTILQVLAFGNTVGGNQNVEFVLASGHQNSLPLGNGGETGQHRIEIGVELRNGGFAVYRAGNFCSF